MSSLLKLGCPTGEAEQADYSPHGITPEHVPELIRLLRDEDPALDDEPEVYAQIHAWRALGQLRAPEAVEPLLELLAEQEAEDDWNDWVTEEVPVVLGRFGPGIVPAVVARLEQRGHQRYAPCYYSNALVEVAKGFPEARAEVVGHLCRVLEAAADNDASVNGFVISDLMDLRATERWPVIERAFATGNVDTMIAGDVQDVKWRMGLGPEPPRRIASPLRQRMVTGPTAKERAEARAKQKKAVKRKNKKKRR